MIRYRDKEEWIVALTEEQRAYLTKHYEEYNNDLRESVDELMDKYDAYSGREQYEMEK